MLNFAINNEMTGSVDFPPFLANNPYLGDMSVMAETSISEEKSESQILKKCSKCGEIRSITDFHKRPDRLSGVKSRCKFCLSEYNKTYSYINKEDITKRKRKYVRCNSDKIAEYNKKYYRDHEAERLLYTKNHKEARAKKYQDNKEKISKWQKKYRQENKEAIAEQDKKYCQTKAGKATSRKRSHKRRALKSSVGYENFNPNEVLERDGYRCQLCGKKTRPDYNCFHSLYPNLDHIVPLNKGGAHTKKNTQCLCHLCNIIKYDTGKGDQLRMFG